MPKLQKTIKIQKGVAMFGLRKGRGRTTGVFIGKANNEAWGQLVY